MKYIKTRKEFINEGYLDGVASTLVDKEWDELYNDAQQEPLKTQLKDALVEIFKDKNVLVAVGDNYEWSDGSNGFINFSNFNHYITDIGYKSYADKPEVINNIEKFKKHILYAYASSQGGDIKRGENYRDFVYDPSDEFEW